MLIAIDVGNTNTVFAVYEDGAITHQWRSATDATRTADDHAVWLYQLSEMHKVKLNKIEGCVISTVVPQAQFNFRNLSRRYLNVEPMFIGDAHVQTGIDIRLPNPKHEIQGQSHCYRQRHSDDV
jgi:type III pantothenate kinase